MNTIQTENLEQTGGFFNAQIVLIDELTYCPVILTNNNASSIVITPTTNNLDILPIAENIKITEKSIKTKSGTLYTINGEFEIPVQSSELDTYFNDHLYKKAVLIGIKHYGQQKMYGSKKFPLDFSYQFVNGKKAEEGNKIIVKVSGKIPQKPVFIND
jgi:hypothetical protein